MSKIKVVNNIKGAVGFYLNPTPESFRVLNNQGLFLHIGEEELNYINVNQKIIQKGILWIDDKDIRIKLGLELEDGTKTNSNVLQYDEIVEMVKGNYKKLEKVLGEITEKTISQQFVEAARESGIDSRAKIDIIEKATGQRIYEDEE